MLLPGDNGLITLNIHIEPEMCDLVVKQAQQYQRCPKSLTLQDGFFQARSCTAWLEQADMDLDQAIALLLKQAAESGHHQDLVSLAVADWRRRDKAVFRTPVARKKAAMHQWAETDADAMQLYIRILQGVAQNIEETVKSAARVKMAHPDHSKSEKDKAMSKWMQQAVAYFVST